MRHTEKTEERHLCEKFKIEGDEGRVKRNGRRAYEPRMEKTKQQTMN